MKYFIIFPFTLNIHYSYTLCMYIHVNSSIRIQYKSILADVSLNIYMYRICVIQQKSVINVPGEWLSHSHNIILFAITRMLFFLNIWISFTYLLYFIALRFRSVLMILDSAIYRKYVYNQEIGSWRILVKFTGILILRQFYRKGTWENNFIVLSNTFSLFSLFSSKLDITSMDVFQILV